MPLVIPGSESTSARPTAPSRSSTATARRGSRNFPRAHGSSPTFPSVLYFEPKKPSVAGAEAIERYLASETKGRFIQSLKAYLADRTFEGTGIGTQHYTLERLIALIGKHMSERLGLASWPSPRRIILGRPVHFSQPAGPRARRLRHRATAVGDPARRLRRDRVRVRAGRGGLRLRGAPAARRAHPDRRLRRRHQRLHHHLDRTRRAPPRATGVGHHRHRRRADRRRRVRQAHHPQPGRAAARHGRRVPLAAQQVPAGAQLAVRTARALALPVVPEVAVHAGDARAGSRAPRRPRSGSKPSCC